MADRIEQGDGASSGGFVSSLTEVLPPSVQRVTSQISALVKEHPYLFATLAVFSGAGLYTAWREYNRIDRVLKRLVDQCHLLPITEDPLPMIENAVGQIWAQLELPPSCNNRANHRFLARKLQEIIRHKEIHDQDPELKKEIILNVIRNLRTRLLEGLNRVQEDINAQRLAPLFPFATDPNPIRAEILADETHNDGAVPISFTLRGGDRLVYKPRSMQSEWAICGDEASNPNSLFRRIGLPTYSIYRGDGYGYSSFLQNLRHENTLNTVDEVIGLYRTFWRIHAAAYSVGLGDLHPDNIINQRLFSYLIDTEVIGLPESAVFQTNLWGSGEVGAFIVSPNSKNRIWFSNDFASTLLGPNFSTIESVHYELREHGLTGRIQTALGAGFIDFIRTIPTVEPLPEHREDLDELGISTHNRIALVNTLMLSHIIGKTIEEGWVEFVESVRDGLTDWEFTIDNDQLLASRAQFERDVRSNDIPIFYYNREERRVYYNDYAIGFMSAASSSSPSSSGSSF